MQKRDDDIIPYRGKWALSWYDASGQRKRTSLDGLDATDENYPAAQRKADDLRRELKLAARENLPDTIASIYGAYLADKRGRVIKIDDLENSWKALKSFWGGLRVDQITRENCRAYIAERRHAGKADGTILKQLGSLKAAINWAGRGNAAVFEMPSQPEARHRHLSEDELFRLLDATRQDHFRLWLHIAIATAARKSAILDLTWEDGIDFEAGTINFGVKVVNGKKGKARTTVPMTKTVRAALEVAYTSRRGPFVIQYNGQRVANIRKAFEDTATRAGLVDVTPHDIRHTAAVWMLGKRVPMHMVSQYLGHADTRITEKVYARYQPDHLKEASEALELGPRLRVVG